VRWIKFTFLLFYYCMFIYSQYTLSYFSITVSSVYVAKCAHSYSQESLVRESAAQKSDGNLIVQAPGSSSSVSLLLRGLQPHGPKFGSRTWFYSGTPKYNLPLTCWAVVFRSLALVGDYCASWPSLPLEYIVWLLKN
jgi:hypothetical protein